MSDDSSSQADVKPNVGGGDPITVSVKGVDGAEVHFKIKTSTKMGKVFEAFAKRKGLQAGELRFMHDGQRVKAEDTPASANLEDGDQIDCVMEVQGGSQAPTPRR